MASDTGSGALGKAQATMIEYIAARAREGSHGETTDLVAVINAAAEAAVRMVEAKQANAEGNLGTVSNKVWWLVGALSIATSVFAYVAIQSQADGRQFAIDIATLKQEIKQCLKSSPP